MIPDAKQEPDYVYQESPPEVAEMRCPEEQYLSCCQWFSPHGLLKHYEDFHKEYKGMDADALDVIFEQERIWRYGR